MSSSSPLRLVPDADGIETAAGLLSDGRLVAFPTETVYGLGADARNGTAVAEIYAAKGRPAFNPLIVHVADTSTAQNFAEWSETADRLAKAFWPGPLTLVLPLRSGHGLSALVTAGLDTVALRAPARASARALLERFGGPVAGPSANPSGRISPTTADHVLSGLGSRIAAVIDDGPCEVGIESTIVGLSEAAPVLLRAGGLPVEALEAALGGTLALPTGSGISAPGQLRSHYAPEATLRLDAKEAQGNEVLLGFGPMDCTLNLSARGDLTEAASRLFDHMHSLDRMQRTIAVAPVPDTGLGRGINDRLRRAAAPRDQT